MGITGTKRKGLFLFLILTVGVMFCSSCSGDEDSATMPDWSANEITIATESELIKFAALVNGGKNFFSQTVTLRQNINISAEKWIPIGDLSSNSFRGTFDGGGFLISGVGESPIDGFSGLFGYLLGGVIKNLGVEVKMNFDNSATLAAGLVTVNVGEILNCYVFGSITISSPQENFVGGAIVAINDGRIKNTYSKADISESNSVGRFVGENLRKIESSYALKGNSQGKFVAYDFGEICENPALKSAEELKTQSTFINWNFVNIWKISSEENGGFPLLLTANSGK